MSEEPTIVESFAEPGAEDGAGAQITVDEPWEGYGRLTARDLVACMGAASTAELAAIQLYESLNRQRETVLTAVERELKIKSGNRPAADQTTKEQANGR